MELITDASAIPHPDSPPEPLPTNKEGLVQFAKLSHKYFDDFIWRQNPQAQVKSDDGKLSAPSYHNHNHIDAMIQVTKALISACKTGQDPKQDPLKLNEQLDIWNDQHPDQVRLTLVDLETALEIASACHDLGNITQTENFQLESGELRLNYAKKYETAPGTADIETRGADITEKLIDHFFTTPEDKAKIEHLKPLIRHLIMQTVFDPDVSKSDQCFWQAIQYADQIGTYYFPSQSRTQSIAGLLNEMRARGDPPPPILAGFLLFPDERARALIPDEKIRSQIVDILIDSQGHEIAPIPPDINNGSERPVDYEADIIKLITTI